MSEYSQTHFKRVFKWLLKCWVKSSKCTERLINKFHKGILNSWEISSKSVCSKTISLIRQKIFLPINLVPRVPFFYIRTKFRLKNRVTTVHLLQCKTIFFVHLCFWGRNLRQIKEHPSWETSINIKKKFFLILLHLSTFIYIRLD